MEDFAMTKGSSGRRVIEVNRQIIGPATPRPKCVRPKKISDFVGVPKVYLDVAEKLSSPLLMGPPLCDELIAFVQHLFTEEEAGLVRHLGKFGGMTARQLARAEHRPLEQVEPILLSLAVVKRAIASGGDEGKKKYRLMPIMPGIFEMVLIGQFPETISPWHRRFAELFEALYETGYTLDYEQGKTHPTPLVRVLSVGRVIDAHPMALPSDRLEVVLDRFDVFGIGQCQCRMAMQVAGRSCGKPLGNCTVMGQWAEQGIGDGWLKRVPRKEVLEIKREAESHGLVTWLMNVEATKGQASCSCCGCCCHAMRIVNEFNAPGVMAPAHFLPRFDDAQCVFCGKCAKTCPMGALRVDVEGRLREHRIERCIGCGLCVVACGDLRAVAMEPVPDYRLPYKSWFSLLMHTAPAMLGGAWNVWRRR
jgi:Pyruvate/2-oxoacid:ferredoxin oxidoreductase delta subunit